MPRFSVIVSAYPVQAYLRGCPDSGRARSWADLEVTAAGDRWPDACGKTVGERAARGARVRPLRLPENVGRGGAREAGPERTAGDSAVCLDGDDTLTPSAPRALARFCPYDDSRAAERFVRRVVRRVGQRVMLGAVPHGPGSVVPSAGTAAAAGTGAPGAPDRAVGAPASARSPLATLPHPAGPRTVTESLRTPLSSPGVPMPPSPSRPAPSRPSTWRPSGRPSRTRRA
ncbi:glycosyltransferase family 2 protein [Streptomyces sp. bgisy154]|uniref:glycosyltransferase family 2 protein n=1 Tax=Streptomyces sp. bgisy154 TaxID=3413794 RepID=UPI003D711EAC